MTGLCPIRYAEQTRTKPDVLYGAVGWKRRNGERIACQSVTADMSADIHRPLGNNEWSGLFHLKDGTIPSAGEKGSVPPAQTLNTFMWHLGFHGLSLFVLCNRKLGKPF